MSGINFGNYPLTTSNHCIYAKIICSIYAEVAEFNASPFVKDKIVPARFYDWFVYQNSAIQSQSLHWT